MKNDFKNISDSTRYKIAIGTDSLREGKYLELIDLRHISKPTVLELFYNYRTHKMELSFCKHTTEIEVINECVKLATIKLVPHRRAVKKAVVFQ